MGFSFEDVPKTNVLTVKNDTLFMSDALKDLIPSTIIDDTMKAIEGNVTNVLMTFGEHASIVGILKSLQRKESTLEISIQIDHSDTTALMVLMLDDDLNDMKINVELSSNTLDVSFIGTSTMIGVNNLEHDKGLAMLNVSFATYVRS